ncbi:hypothetical protein ACROYT_G027935 [Oculina patagonica]
MWHVQTANDSKYHLDKRGILQIRDMAEADNGTTYRCTVQPCLGCYTESVFIILLFDPEEDKISLVQSVVIVRNIQVSNLRVSERGSSRMPGFALNILL